MKFDDILGAKDEIIALGEEGSKYLSDLQDHDLDLDDYLNSRKAYYGRLVATVSFLWAE